MRHGKCGPVRLAHTHGAQQQVQRLQRLALFPAAVQRHKPVQHHHPPRFLGHEHVPLFFFQPLQVSLVCLQLFDAHRREHTRIVLLCLLKLFQLFCSLTDACVDGFQELKSILEEAQIRKDVSRHPCIYVVPLFGNDLAQLREVLELLQLKHAVELLEARLHRHFLHRVTRFFQLACHVIKFALDVAHALVLFQHVANFVEVRSHLNGEEVLGHAVQVGLQPLHALECGDEVDRLLVHRQACLWRQCGRVATRAAGGFRLLHTQAIERAARVVRLGLGQQHMRTLHAGGCVLAELLHQLPCLAGQMGACKLILLAHANELLQL
mmetsp:Transcript_23426/g.58600  ORF Transcript_23426/g.58600 Transcript_23426/m.58600 type:complete len:323 (-) Transcript_23426:110-1078(-)